MSFTQDDLTFLTSAQGARLVSRLVDENLSDQMMLQQVTALRQHYGAQQTRAALQLARLRQRATAKFGADAAYLFFTDDALQQASDPLVRAYRAQDSGGLRVLDVCCGIGADSLALARAGAEVTAVDYDSLRLEMARLNAQALGLSITFELADVREASYTGWDRIFYDPARRDKNGRRLHDVEHYLPPLSLIHQWDAAQIMVKLSPAVDLAQLTRYGARVDFISVNGDLKEATLVTGAAGVRAIRLDEDTGAQTWQRTGVEPSIGLRAPQGWLCEPDPALIRAGLVKDVAAAHDGALLDATIAYFVADAAPQSRWVRGWRIREWLPFQLKRLRATLREHDIGTLTVKKRGSPLQPDELIRKLKLRGTQSATLVLTRYQGDPVAIICDDIA